MSNTKPNNAAQDAAAQKLTDEAAKLSEVPAQKSTGKKTDLRVGAALVVDDALMAIEQGRLNAGVTMKLYVGEDGGLQVDIVEDGKVKNLADKAKGVFRRNKKFVLATTGLVATSVLLKVLANRQAALEADDLVESSDDVSVDA